MRTTDSGAYITPRFCGAASALAAGAGDNTEVDGVYIDRQGFMSATLVIGAVATLAAAATLSLAHNLQHDADGTGAGTDFGVVTGATVRLTGGGGGTTERIAIAVRYNLATAMRYVRAQFTPNLSAGGTDTAIVAAILLLGGADELPNDDIAFVAGTAAVVHLNGNA